MDWTADTFIDRVLRRPTTHWWAEHQSESALEKRLSEELASDIPDFLSSRRHLFFFSPSGRSSIDGRAGLVGVELKFTHLAFEGIIDGAIHRGVVWTLGDPQQVAAKDAVSLHVVKPKSAAMIPSISGAIAPVLGSLAQIGIHVAFVNSETGAYWRASRPSPSAPMPDWLASREGPGRLRAVREDTIKELEAVEAQTGRERRLLERRATYQEYVGSSGAILARIEWGNEWQMIEIGFLLRGMGCDAVKVVYRGTRPLIPAGRGIERNVQTEMSRRFGVVLDWGVPLDP